MRNPFIRNIQVEISSLRERESTSEPPMYVFFADGTPDHFRVSFAIHKHKITTATPTVIKIYNLKKETRDAITKRELKITIKAGWSNQGLYTFFQGSIMNGVSRRQGPDIITEIYSLAAGGVLGDTVLNKCYQANFPLRDCIIDLAGQLPNVIVDPISIDVKTKAFGSQGFMAHGSVCDTLDRLARIYGFSWHVNNGLFVAIDDKRVRPGIKALISYKNGYLLRAEPMLATPWQKQIGVSVSSWLHPSLEPGGKLQLVTELNDKLNGDYVVHRLQHTGDSHGQDYKSFVESWIVVQ